VLKPLGIQNVSRDSSFEDQSRRRLAVEAMLKKEKAQSGELLVGLFPGAGTWTSLAARELCEVADHLIRNDRVRVIVFAGPEERALVPQMRSVFPADHLF
jgi:hypothetical protein